MEKFLVCYFARGFRRRAAGAALGSKMNNYVFLALLGVCFTLFTAASSIWHVSSCPLLPTWLPCPCCLLVIPGSELPSLSQLFVDSLLKNACHHALPHTPHTSTGLNLRCNYPSFPNVFVLLFLIKHSHLNNIYRRMGRIKLAVNHVQSLRSSCLVPSFTALRMLV